MMSRNTAFNDIEEEKEDFVLAEIRSLHEMSSHAAVWVWAIES